MKKIMFVCTGNTCRSAMAEKLLHKKIIEKGFQNKLEVYSAGVFAFSGDKSPYEAIKVMRDEYAVDMTTHKATPLKDSQIDKMDLILTMTENHKNMLVSLHPEFAKKTFVLREYVGLAGDIVDPYDGSLEVYLKCARELNECLELLMKKEEKEV